MKRVRVAVLLLIVMAITGSMMTGCSPEAMNQDKLVGALLWIGEADEEMPEAEAIQLEYVEEDGILVDIKVNDPQLLYVGLLETYKDGEHWCSTGCTDPRLVETTVKGSVSEAVVYADAGKELHAAMYKIFEREDGQLYAYVEEDAGTFWVGRSGEGFCINGEEFPNRTVEECLFTLELFEDYDKMVVKQFDENDTLIQADAFQPTEDVSLEKAEAAAYTICEYHHGKNITRKVVEDNTVERIVLNPKTHIGEPKHIKMK